MKHKIFLDQQRELFKQPCFLAIGIAKFTGEDFLGKHHAKNPFDTLFLLAMTKC